MTTINLIVTKSKNNVILDVPETIRQIKSEQLRFRKLVTGNAVVMREDTYKRIGHPVADCMNIIISDRQEFNSQINKGNNLTTMIHVPSLRDAFNLVEDMNGIDICVVGDSHLHAQTIPLVDRIYIIETNTKLPVEASTVIFPKFEEAEYEKYMEEYTDYTRMLYIHKASIHKHKENYLTWQDKKKGKFVSSAVRN